MATPEFLLFQQLNLLDQFAVVLREGTFLAQRGALDGEQCQLYHLGSFFVEVAYYPAANHLPLGSLSGTGDTAPMAVRFPFYGRSRQKPSTNRPAKLLRNGEPQHRAQAMRPTSTGRTFLGLRLPTSKPTIDEGRT
jgi:hypothetical protein